MSGYFNYFPTSRYAQAVVTNVIAKVRFRESVRKTAAVFYTYTVQEGERPDQIAENYYQDPTYDWVIYLANDIIDPYHEWPKSQSQFDNHIKAKYGSIANAQLSTAYYTTNYVTDERVLSPAAYAALDSGVKKYWKPIIGYDDTVVNYERSTATLVSDTNAIISLTGTFNGIATGTVLKQGSTAFGTVAAANTSEVVLKHVSGSWQTNTAVSIALSNQAANASVTAVTTIATSVPTAELSYWFPVSVYDHESEQNESKKHIQLIHNSYLDVIERDMKDLLLP